MYKLLSLDCSYCHLTRNLMRFKKPLGMVYQQLIIQNLKNYTQ